MSYAPAMPPRTHQVEANRRLRGKRVFALLMAMRTGKTKVALDDFGEMELEGEVRDLLVLAPAGAYRVWEEEFEKHASADLRERARVHIWRTGGGAGHDNALREFMAESDPRRPRLLIANIEAASMVSDRFRNLLKKYVAQRRAEIVVDESTTIKGNTALRTKFAVNTLNPLSSYRRILSGLPTPNSPLDLYCQFAFLDRSILGFGTYTEFRARYAIMGFIRVQNRLQEIVKDYQNVEELYAKIEPHSYRIKLSDIAEIPATYRRRPIELTPDQKTAYRQLRELAYAELADASLVTAQLVIVRMLRLHQILLGHVVDSDGELKEIGERRTGELLELLDDYDGKAIIWCSYDYNVRRVSEALRKNFGEDSVAQFWGRNISSREEEDKRFRTDPRCRFMVATPASGGRGRRWDVADLVVYFSNTANLEHRDQSEERVKDVERTKAVSYVDFVAEGTVEEKIIEALRRKINLAAVVTGDNFREWLV